MEERQRTKRSFTEMSQAATLSPSPISFRDPASNFLGHAGPSAPPNDPASLFRRRQRGSIQMAEPSQSQRPRLEHRQSQTIIDLTDDVDDEPVPIRNHQPRNRASRPPQLDRSDGSRLQDFVDLTDDSDLIFTGERQLPPRRPNGARPPAPRTPSPHLFVPNRPQHPRAHGVVASPNTRGVISGAFNQLGAMGVIPGGLRNFLGIHVYHHDQFLAPQVMPGAMDYQHVAFAERKPDHIAPPRVGAGFTRSPTDDDIVICPSCEEELIHRKENEEPPIKKGGKAPTKKEREEHPFWVVKECGHVYCNKCFQLRQQASKHDQVNFSEIEKTANKKTKILTCNVEDCQSDVKSKDKWVGVFL